jgi:integrase
VVGRPRAADPLAAGLAEWAARRWSQPSARPGFDGVTSHYFRKTVTTLMDEAACTHVRLRSSLGTRNAR